MADVTITNFNFKYPETSANVLNDLNLTFPDGEFSLLSGPSGSGKTTLLKFIASLYPNFTNGEASGTISFNGTDITTVDPQVKNHLVAMMFQNPNQQFAMSVVRDELIFVLENLQTDPSKMDAIIDHALEFAGISELVDREINSLSGGQKQRLALASIIAMDAEVIVLDEPFASIDFPTRIDLLHKLKQLQTNYHKTIIIADHDLSSYESLIDNFFYLDPEQHQISKLAAVEAQKLFKQFADNRIESIPVTQPNSTDRIILNLHDFSLGPHHTTLLNLSEFSFYEQKTTLITGDNGIGKSTLFSALTKLLPYSGNVFFKDKNIRTIRPLSYAKQVSLLFQDAENQFLAITVQEEIELSKQHRITKNYSDDMITDMIDKLGFTDRMDQVVYSLSEGQKKKLQILEMLIMDPPVLLLDEPFKGLDYKSLQIIVGFLLTAKQQFGQTQIMISHQFTGITDLIDYHVSFMNHNLQYQEVLK